MPKMGLMRGSGVVVVEDDVEEEELVEVVV